MSTPESQCEPVTETFDRGSECYLEIGVEDDSITGFAGAKSFDCVVDAAHRQMFCLRSHLMPRGEVEHRFDGDGRTRR